jgi:hypothetical protein
MTMLTRMTTSIPMTTIMRIRRSDGVVERCCSHGPGDRPIFDWWDESRKNFSGVNYVFDV